MLRGICKRKGTAEYKGIIRINDFLHSNGEAYSYTNDTKKIIEIEPYEK